MTDSAQFGQGDVIANKLLQPRRVVGALGDRDLQCDIPSAAPDVHPDALAGAARIDVDPELPAVLHRLAVQPDDEIAGGRPAVPPGSPAPRRRG